MVHCDDMTPWPADATAAVERLMKQCDDLRAQLSTTEAELADARVTKEFYRQRSNALSAIRTILQEYKDKYELFGPHKLASTLIYRAICQALAIPVASLPDQLAEPGNPAENPAIIRQNLPDNDSQPAAEDPMRLIERLRIQLEFRTRALSAISGGIEQQGMTLERALQEAERGQDIPPELADADGWIEDDILPPMMRCTDGQPWDMTRPVEVKTFRGRVLPAYLRAFWLDPVDNVTIGNEVPVRPDVRSDHVTHWRPEPAREREVAVDARRMVEVYGGDGKVHYRRPEGDPLIDEAHRTAGYYCKFADNGERLPNPYLDAKE